MIGRLDRDEAEEKKCNDYNHGKKFSSYKAGYHAGLRDGKNRDEPPEPNPFPLTAEIWALLRKRARWEAGYAEGRAVAKNKRKK